MIIDNIKESQFRHYHLKAENEIGTKNATLLVTRVYDPVPEPSRSPDPEQSDRDDNSEPLQPKQEPGRVITPRPVSSMCIVLKYLLNRNSQFDAIGEIIRIGCHF